MHISIGGWTLTYDGKTHPIGDVSFAEQREVMCIDRDWVPFGSLRALLLSTVANVVAHHLS